MKKLNELFLSKEFTQNGLAILGFVILSLAVFYPVMSGKKIFQSDIQQYKGMSRELQKHRKEKGEELYWIDNAFMGMPTYQLGARYPYDILTPINDLFRTIPHPAFMLFLYLLGCYVFLRQLKIPFKYAVFGAVAYGLSTYLLIIIEVGHNTKALAMGYFPFVMAGILLVFQKKYWIGIVLTTFAAALNIRANHYQMTYYLLFLILLFLGVQFWKDWKRKEIRSFFKKTGMLSIAAVLALGLNATPLLATAEYTDFSTRGKSELTLSAEGNPIEKKTGLSYEYITQYSYGIFESLSLIVPRIQGGGGRENLGESSEIYKFLIQKSVPKSTAKSFSENVPTYWGGQPILVAPAYVGIIVFFLALLSVFLGWTSTKRWLVLGSILSLALSWGKNFVLLTSFFIDYVPLYNKFRTVASIQVILEFCLPVLASIGLYEFCKSIDKAKNIKALKQTAITLSSLFGLLFLLKGIMTFRGGSDYFFEEQYGAEIMRQIVLARKTIFNQDLLRAFILVGLSSFVLYLQAISKFSKRRTFFVLFGLLFFDLIGVSNRYLDRSLFLLPSQMKTVFKPTVADKIILKDTTRFRVYEPEIGLNGARKAYFHNTIGGYHGAKPRRLEEIYDLLGYEEGQGILNILNVKYILYTNDEGEKRILQNPDELGNAWFIEKLIASESADETYQGLKELDFEKEALSEGLPAEISLEYKKDSLSTINLIEGRSGYLKYKTQNSNDGFAVFSEMYYKKGWKASIDGKNVPHFSTDYVLRGMQIPKGEHIVEFVFEPEVVKLGSKIRFVTLIVLFLMLFFFWYSNQRKNKNNLNS